MTGPLEQPPLSVLPDSDCLFAAVSQLGREHEQFWGDFVRGAEDLRSALTARQEGLGAS